MEKKKKNDNAISAGDNSANIEDDSEKDDDDDEAILRRALELFYLWVTFAPLSRGTAACGYAGFCAVLLAFGKQVRTGGGSSSGGGSTVSSDSGTSSRSSTGNNNSTALLPAGKQLDWEAILAEDFDSFWSAVSGWFTLVPVPPESALLPALQHPWFPLQKDTTGAGTCDTEGDAERTTSTNNNNNNNSSTSSTGKASQLHLEVPMVKSANASVVTQEECDAGPLSCIRTLRDMLDLLSLPY